MNYQILLVEDDEKIREIIVDYFEDKSNGEMKIICAESIFVAEDEIYEREYDLVLLDIMLPDGNGFSLCRAIRGRYDVPVIFLTARGGEEDKLYGYSSGCDDYIVKPFNLGELYAKVNALIKRAKGMVMGNIITAGGVCLNPIKMTVTVNSTPLELSPKLYMLLKYLMEHKNKVVSRETLLIHIWGYDFDGTDRVVDNHIKKLRKALGTYGSQIKTVVSIGYRMEG